MQQPNSQELMDCISAKQLLKALTTLQQLSSDSINEVQLSFSQQSHSLFNTASNQSNMDFQLYMALKNNNKKTDKQRKMQNGSKKQKDKQNISIFKKKQTNIDRNNVEKIQNRKSLTPLKQRMININDQNKSKQPSRVENIQDQIPALKRIKSKSHSPIDNRRDVTPRSIYNGPSASLYPKPRSRLQQEMLPGQEKQKQPTIKLNQVSKKILLQRQKQGKCYIPIQQRTSQLIREKQEKIAKMQRASIVQKQFQQRQCTFKPVINCLPKGSKIALKQRANRHRMHTVGEQSIICHEEGKEKQLLQQNESRINISNKVHVSHNTNTSHNTNDKQNKQKNGENNSSVEMYKTERKNQCGQNKQDKSEDPSHKQLATKRKEKEKQKRKNDKFNILLDLIN